MIKRFSIIALIVIFLSAGTYTQSTPPVATATVESDSILAFPLILSWKFDSDETTSVTPATDGKQVYVPLASGGIVALSAATGDLIWRESLGGQISAEPAADGNAVYVANEIVGPKLVSLQANGAIRALSRDSGVTLWMRTLPFSLQGGLVSDNLTVFGASADGRVYAFSKRDGHVLWVKQFSSAFVSHPLVFNGRLYLGADDGFLFVLDSQTGGSQWMVWSTGRRHFRWPSSRTILRAGRLRSWRAKKAGRISPSGSVCLSRTS